MGNLRPLFAAVATVAASHLLAACAAPVARQPTVVGYDRTQRAEVWNRAVVLLQARNYNFRILNEASGTISTEPANAPAVSCGISTCQVRQSVSLTVSPTGSIVCNINRVLSSPLVQNPWEPSDAEGVRAVEADQAELVRAILSGPPAPAASSGGEAMLAHAPQAAPAPAPGIRCYTTAGAAVTVEAASCTAAGLSDTLPPPPPPAPAALHCYTPTGVEVPINAATCASAGLSSTRPPPPVPLAPTSEALPAGPRRHHHR